MTTHSDNNRIVIIGHGLSGLELSKELLTLAKKKSASISITVVDSRDFYEMDMGMPYALLQKQDINAESYATSSCLQSQLKVEGVSYKKDTVRSVAARSGGGFTLLTAGGTTIEANVVVCATGFTIPVLKPATGMDWGARREEIDALRAALSTARTVVIAGSGNAGVELAGEVRLYVDTASGCKVHLICSSDLVLNDTFGEGDRRHITNKIRDAPGMVLHTDRVVGEYGKPSLSPSTVKLKSGNTIAADVYLPCFAKFLAGEYLSQIDGAALSNGQVAVNQESLESTAVKGLFAIGCSDIVQQEGHISSPKIMGQVKTVAANVLAYLAGTASVVHTPKMGFVKHDIYSIFGTGYFSMLHTEKCGIPGMCCRYLCGFPFPCLFGCCLCGCDEGPCGYTCMRPAGGGHAKAIQKFKVSGKLINSVIGHKRDNVKKGLVDDDVTVQPKTYTYTKSAVV